ncbi:hypothetical protein YZ70_06995 [Campylobacter concisus]|uniref:hypothetical protein n=1 Tax=Campylobacter concisus TaxID=199 RepID=UPI00187FB6A7|nr:hypothetical protein [Campylobacter concisus]MBE8585214.1 hypothetical protein [Campylobacter concisus]
MLEKNSQNQIRSFSLKTNVRGCSSLRVEAKFSFKFDLCILNLPIEILNFCRLVKIVVENLVIKSLKLAFGRSNLEPKTLYLLKNLEIFSI